jgi:hypothetical protein
MTPQQVEKISRRIAFKALRARYRSHGNFQKLNVIQQHRRGEEGRSEKEGVSARFERQASATRPEKTECEPQGDAAFYDSQY